jgi:glycosyltransferase involved in cell wall biosynthesis
MSTFSLFGGTPKKTLDLIKFGGSGCFLYVWSKGGVENKSAFEEAGAKVYEGYYGRNIYNHVIKLLKIIDENEIDIIQTQFSFGEILAGLAKIFRPKIKIINAFVGSASPNGLKKIIINHFYKKVDHFVFISNYVQSEKQNAFPVLKTKKSIVILNGTERRRDSGDDCAILKPISLLDVAGLTQIKNISVLVEALYILITEYNQKKVYLYIAGDGPKRNELDKSIKKLGLTKHVFLLGYQKNIGRLLNSCNIFVHPCYEEGFGIAVAEAMMVGKPIIVSNAGALPELVENNTSGLVVKAQDASEWAAAIDSIIRDKHLAKRLGDNARKRAEELFSVEQYVKSYEELYNSVMAEKK